jgi:hypothetical protein
MDFKIEKIFFKVKNKNKLEFFKNEQQNFQEK